MSPVADQWLVSVLFHVRSTLVILLAAAVLWVLSALPSESREIVLCPCELTPPFCSQEGRANHPPLCSRIVAPAASPDPLDQTSVSCIL